MTKVTYTPKRKVTSTDRAALAFVIDDAPVTLTADKHAELISLLKEKLAYSTRGRSATIERYRYIDREVNGYIVPTTVDEKQADADNKAGLPPKPVPAKIQLVKAKIDDIVTYIMSVIAPDDALYGAAAGFDQQAMTLGVTRVLNKHADMFDHYGAYVKGITDLLKYAFGGWRTAWEERDYRTVKNTALGGPSLGEGSYAGNAVYAIDPYNTILDPSVPAKDVPTHGEFIFEISRATRFAVEREARAGNYTNVSSIKWNTAMETQYYEAPPDLDDKQFATNKSSTSSVDWYKALGGTTDGKSQVTELWDAYIWLDMADYIPALIKGKADKDAFGIWHITVAAGNHVIAIEKLSNAHERLPFGLATPSADGFDAKGRSIAELLIPLQNFASFALNTHQAAIQKKLYGMMLYDESVWPIDDMAKASMLGAKLKAKTTAANRDLRMSFVLVNDAPDTSNTMTDISAAIDMMNRLMPTDMQRQVADLQRATEYQAAATVIAASRRLLKLAKVINGQALKQVRQQFLYNLWQSTEVITVTDEQTLEQSIVDPAMLRDKDIEFLISDGLKGLDRMLIANALKDTIHMLLQNPREREKVNMLSMISYYFSLMGDKTDFNQFRHKSLLDDLTPEEQQLALQLLQQAGAAPQLTAGTDVPQPTGAPQ